jgi:hypothetical protein
MEHEHGVRRLCIRRRDRVSDPQRRKTPTASSGQHLPLIHRDVGEHPGFVQRDGWGQQRRRDSRRRDGFRPRGIHLDDDAGRLCRSCCARLSPFESGDRSPLTVSSNTGGAPSAHPVSGMGALPREDRDDSIAPPVRRKETRGPSPRPRRSGGKLTVHSHAAGIDIGLRQGAFHWQRPPILPQS